MLVGLFAAKPTKDEVCRKRESQGEGVGSLYSFLSSDFRGGELSGPEPLFLRVYHWEILWRI